MARLLLVSNRLPLSVKVERGQVSIVRSAGGVATGLREPHDRSEGLWFGWPGDVSDLTADQRGEYEHQLAELRAVPLYLTRAEVRRFYDDFSNGVLWPLFHYLVDRIPLDAKGWNAYRRVNERFADLVASHYRDGDTIWVHDYQLMLVPGLLRARLPHARIGFFLHIPFPAADIFRILPWRDAVLQGLLGADLVGFHAFSYQSHFTAALLRVLGIENDIGTVRYRGRTVRLGVFPMGVDAARLSAMADEPTVVEEAAAIRAQHAGVRILLGIDRLDYTKGIPRRLMAVERLLEQQRSQRGKVRMIQVTVPSRVKVEAYAAFRRQVDELVGKINGTYSTLTTPPVHYLYQSFSERYISALYRAADVMLVTPLRDGMNLVSKEFVAARNDEDGVLVLSELAGAAAELGESIQVNPYDIDGVAKAIQRALAMPARERRSRMRALRRRVFEGDVHNWVHRFLSTLESVEARPRRDTEPTPFATAEVLSERMRATRPLVLMLEYDGTLVPYASAPDLAAPDREARQLLQALANLPDVSTHVVSGRGREAMQRWFGGVVVSLHAEDGYWFKPPGKNDWQAARRLPEDWKERVRPILEDFARRTPGTLLEEKSGALAWHYRMAEAEFGALQARDLRAHLEVNLGNAPLEVVTGHRVVEVRLHRVDRGLAVTRGAAASGSFELFVVIGSDAMDEKLFTGLPKNGVQVRVNSKRDHGGLQLADWQAVRGVLRALVRSARR